MDHTEDKIQNHLDAAKKELKNAAEGVIEMTKADINESIANAKDKVNEVVGDMASSVSAAADKVHDEVSKKDSKTKS